MACSVCKLPPATLAFQSVQRAAPISRPLRLNEASGALAATREPVRGRQIKIDSLALSAQFSVRQFFVRSLMFVLDRTPPCVA